MKRVAIAFVLVACRPHATPTPAPPIASAAPSASVAPSAPACASSGTKIENGACATDADCVLTELPAECNACNLQRAYPALKTAFDKRNALCDAGACDAASCPGRDLDTRAFYRAECKDHRCIAWRYHGGG